MEKVASHINEMQKLHEDYGAVFDQLVAEQSGPEKEVSGPLHREASGPGLRVTLGPGHAVRAFLQGKLPAGLMGTLMLTIRQPHGLGINVPNFIPLV